MQVGNEELIVENFKTHLKDRNLIKFKDFDTIESIERLRDNFVSISDKYKNDFLNDNKLPWPGFFINKNLFSFSLQLWRIMNYVCVQIKRFSLF